MPDGQEIYTTTRTSKEKWCDDLPATITHVPVADVPVLNIHDDGRLRPKHVEWLCINKTSTVLHQVGFYLTYTMIHGNTNLKK